MKIDLNRFKICFYSFMQSHFRWLRGGNKHDSDSIPMHAIVPRSLVDQAKSFTAPRGRLEMGGLLMGHVDQSGRNVCVVGFFPEQTEESSGYCEFDGGWMAVAASAAEYANESNGRFFDNTPPIRVIGWIHTHPGIGLFLSGTDVSTYKANLNMSPDGRFVAVVVDPIRNEDGVFLSPERPNDYYSAEGDVVLKNGLKRRYMKFLSKMEEIRAERGREALPFIMCGDLRAEHVAAGNPDDHVDSYLQSVNTIRDEMKIMHERLEGLRIRANEAIEVVAQRIDEIEDSFERMYKVIDVPEDNANIEIGADLESMHGLPVSKKGECEVNTLVSVIEKSEESGA